LRLDDSHARVSDGGRHRDPLFVDRQLVDRRGLEVFEDRAGRRVAQLIEEWRLRGGVGERLCGGLENDRSLDGHEPPPF